MEHMDNITTALALVNPNGNMDAVANMRKLIITAQEEVVARINADTAAITAENYGKAKLNAFDSEKDYFDKGMKLFEDQILEATGAKGVMVQLVASLNAVKVALKEREEKIRALKAENDPPVEKFDYIVEMAMTQKDFENTAKKWTKDGVEFRARRALDNEKVKIGRIFE